MPPLQLPSLFSPIRVGQMHLQHRVVFAPVTRLRATPHARGRLPVNPLMSNYYEQRSRRPGTLVITEGTLVSEEDASMCIDCAPGIWSRAQAREWRKVADAVHANGSFVFMQLWGQGRPLRPSNVARRPAPPLSSHKELSISEIKEYIGSYVSAARRAVHEAGFDGVEVHAGNGYLLDQFLQDVTNRRSDEYGGSVQSRNRLPLEVMRAVVEEVGEERMGVRISPWSTYQGMGMKHPIPPFTHLVEALRTNHPNLAYLHVIEPELDPTGVHKRNPEQSNDFIRRLWHPRPLISCEGYTRHGAFDRAEQNDGEMVAFGRMFVSNVRAKFSDVGVAIKRDMIILTPTVRVPLVQPDLPDRLQQDIPLTSYDPNTFYQGGETGYTDYVFARRGAPH